jgi:hypothetical protein
MASPEDYIIRLTDPAGSNGELTGSTFLIKPFTVNGPQHPSLDNNFVDPETGNATSRRAPIVLYGKGVPAYGEQMASNLLQITENFSGASAPLIGNSPLSGVTWFQDEKYWVDTAAQDVYVWDDDTASWVDVTSLASTNTVNFGLAGDRSTTLPAPITGDYYYATDTGELTVWYVWTEYTPTFQGWVDRLSRNEAFAPTTESPRRTLSTYIPTDNGTYSPQFVRMLSYRGNDAGDPIDGELHITGNAFAAAPTASGHVTTKQYVDDEITAAIGGSNELYQLLDVDTNLDAGTGNTPPPTNGQVLIFDTALADASYDGKWTAKTLDSTDISDFTVASDARIAAAVIDDLSDVTITAPSNGEVLTYNAGVWENSSVGAEVYVDPNSGTPYSTDLAGNVALSYIGSGDTLNIDNITPLDHVSVTWSDPLAHDASQIDWDGGVLPNAGGPPNNVEEAIVLLDSAISATSGGYSSINVIGSTVLTANSGEAIAGQFEIESANSLLTIAGTNDGPNDNILFTVNNGAINHDALLNYDPNDHVDHTSVSPLAGDGVSVIGSDISTDFTYALDIDSLIAESTIDGANDYFVMWDDSAGAHRKVLGNDLPGGGGGLANAYSTIEGDTGATTINASGADTVRLQSADNKLSVVAAGGSPDNVTFTVNESNIIHDNLSGFVANEHINHSSVVLTAGAGLLASGTGDITTSRTFDVGAGDGIVVNANDVALASSVAGAGLTFTTGVIDIGAGTGISVAANSVSVNEAAVNHDNLQNFVANEHINHGSIVLSAGAGLTGGGDITSSRSFAVGAGDGINVNANDVEVDSTVVRTSGAQTINGTKTFGSAIEAPLGSAASPSYSFSGDNDTGMFRRGANDIGWSTGGTETLFLLDNGDLEADGDMIAFSDIRNKENLLVIDNALDRISKLSGYTYDKKNSPGRRYTGVIAQEVKEVLPEAVHENREDGLMGVAYGNMAGLFIEAIKQLQAEVAQLKAQLKARDN